MTVFPVGEDSLMLCSRCYAVVTQPWHDKLRETSDALAEAQRERDEARMARDHRETKHGAEKERRLAAEADNEELLELLGRYKDLTEALRSRVDYQGPQWWCLSALLDSFDEADTAIREARRGE